MKKLAYIGALVYLLAMPALASNAWDVSEDGFDLTPNLDLQVRVPGPGGATIAVVQPGMVNWVSGSSTLTNATGTTVNSCPSHDYCLPTIPTLTANFAIIGVQYASTPATTLTVSDSAADTCAVINTTAAVNSRLFALAYCKNLTAGVSWFRANFSVDVAQVSMSYEQLFNIDPTSPIDTSVTNTSASGSSTVQAGSITPGSANKYLVQAGVRTQTPKSASCGVGVANCFTAGSGQSGISWTMHISDTVDGMVFQDGLYTDSAAINPQFTMAAASGYASVAVTLNPATSGSARPAGTQVVGIQHLNEPTGAATNHFQMRTEGNLLVASHGFGGAAYTTTGYTDSNSATWTHGAIGQLGDGSSGKSDMWFLGNATPTAALLLNNATSGAASDYSIWLFDVQGMATSPFTQGFGLFRGSPTATATYNILESNEIAPAVDSGIAIGNMSQATNTSQSISSPSGAVFCSTTFGGENISGDATHPPDENNACWFHLFTNGNSFVHTIGEADAALSVGGNAGQVAFFKSATAVAAKYFSDDFNRADVNPVRTSLNIIWTPYDSKSGMKIASNAAATNSQSSDDGVLYVGAAGTSTVTWPNDQYAQCTLGTLTGTGSGNGPGVFLRGSTAAATGYRVVVNATVAGTNTFLNECSAGTCTSRATANSGATWVAGDIVYAEVTTVGADALIKVRKGSGGSDIISFTDTTPIASGSAGMAFSSSMTASSCDASEGGPK